MFPQPGAEAVSHRLPFLEVPARCWALNHAGLELVEQKRPADVFDLYRGLRGGTHNVEEGLELINPLLAWLERRNGLVEDERTSYRTWHYMGRQVLTLRMAGLR